MTTYFKIAEDGVLKAVLEGTKEELLELIASDLETGAKQVSDNVEKLKGKLAELEKEEVKDMQVESSILAIKIQIESNEKELERIQGLEATSFQVFALDLVDLTK